MVSLDNRHCHRVVNSQGRMALGETELRALLENEGEKIKANGRIDMSVSLLNISYSSYTQKEYGFRARVTFPSA